MADMEWQIASQTHRGNVRKTNEDALCVRRQFPLLVVADGMGGHLAGEVASQMLVDNLAKLVLDEDLTTATQQVERSFLASNDRIREYAQAKLNGRTIGSTVVAMLADGDKGACLWAGDSRLYRLRGREFTQLSEDHSVVADMVRNGELTPEQAASHPSANVITRAVGASPQLTIDIKTIELRLQDTYLLCSDGLYGVVQENELANALAGDDVYRSADQLLKLCLNRPARDNVSFIIGRLVAADTLPSDATLTYFPD